MHLPNGMHEHLLTMIIANYLVFLSFSFCIVLTNLYLCRQIELNTII